MVNKLILLFALLLFPVSAIGDITFNGVTLDGIAIENHPVTMPEGDSITTGTNEAQGTDGGYRFLLQAMLGVNDSTFVGLNTNPASAIYSTGFNAWAGDLSEDVSGRISSDLSTYMGSIRKHSRVLLMIGMNDCVQSLDTDTAASNIGSVITAIHSYNPDINIYVAKVTSHKTAGIKTCISTLNGKITTTVSGLQTSISKTNLFLVDMFTPFDGNENTYLWDNLHPNPAGYALIAQTWYTAIQANLASEQ